MGWFNNVENPKIKSQKKVQSNTPTGIWKKCVSCSEIIQHTKLVANQNVCPLCDHHYRLNAQERINLLLDDESFIELGQDLATKNPLSFEDKKSYEERLKLAYDKTGRTDGTLAGHGLIDGREIAVAIMDFSFMGGSMGVVTGEKIALAMDYGAENNVPVLVLSCSGGARMQEGILSLMQMAKTSAARKRLAKKNVPYISLLTDPTTGGCAASFSMQGDINIAEPKALIGFAGPRVIEQSIRQTLPDGFQRSEFLLEHGQIDRIVHRHQLRDELSFLLKIFEK